jgi:hypothetical protein
MWQYQRQSWQRRHGALCRHGRGSYGSICADGFAMTISTTAMFIAPAAKQRKQLVPTRTRLLVGSSNSNTSASCARQQEVSLAVTGRGIAAKYRFTDLAYGTHPATRDYEKWNGEMFVYPVRQAARRKKPVLSRRTVRIVPSDIRKAGNGGAVCPTAPDIDEPPRCPTAPDISRLPFPSAGDEGIQGSSTVRAPAQAGDAGSSPAPVAKPDLTTMVLDIVTAQLNELESRRRRAAT